MLNKFIVCIVLFIFWISKGLLIAQSSSDLCIEWKYKMDTTSNVEFALKESRLVYDQVDEKCKTDILIIYAEIYRLKANLDSALFYFDEAAIRAERSGNNNQLISVYFRKARTLLRLKGTEESMEYLRKTRLLLNNDSESSSWVGYFSTMATIANLDSDYYEALSYTDSALQVAIQYKDSIEIPDSYHNLGFYNLKLGNYEKATEQIIQSIELKKMIPGSELESSYYILGDAYNKWGQIDVGKKYLEEALKISLQNGSDRLTIGVFSDGNNWAFSGTK